MNLNLPTSLPLRHSAIVAVAFLASAAAPFSPAAAQTRGSEAREWEVPRTAFGHPDLQGNWTNATLTPFVRRAGQAPTLNLEEVARIESGQAATVAERAAPSDPDRPLPPEGGTDPICITSPTACYNEVYRDPGDRVAVVNGEPRSSLVTNPPDGRVPGLTRAGQRRAEESSAFASQFGEFDNPESRPLAERCIVSFGSSAGPPMLPNLLVQQQLHDRAERRLRDDLGGDGARRTNHPAR